MDNTTLPNTSVSGNISAAANTTLPVPVVGPPSPVYEFVLNVIVIKIFTIILVIVGMMGNSISIVILSRKRNRRSSTANFLVVLAISDNLILCFGTFTNWIKVVWDINVRNTSGFGCMLHIYFSYVPPSVSSWMLALVTIERVVSVVWPYKVKEWCTVKRSRLAIGFTILFICLLNLHFFVGFTAGYNEFLDAACSSRSAAYTYFLSYVMTYIDFTITFLIPCAIITTGNVVIVRQLAKNRARRKAMTSSDNKSGNGSAVTRTLVMAGVVFVVTVSPITVLLIALDPWKKTAINPWILTPFLRIIFNVLSDLNAAVNFFLYVLSGTKFRQEVRDLFTCHCGRSSSNVGVFDEPDRSGLSGSCRKQAYTIS